MTTTDVPRRQAGVPEGGQFAGQTRPPAGVTLSKVIPGVGTYPFPPDFTDATVEEYLAWWFDPGPDIPDEILENVRAEYDRTIIARLMKVVQPEVIEWSRQPGNEQPPDPERWIGDKRYAPYKATHDKWQVRANEIGDAAIERILKTTPRTLPRSDVRPTVLAHMAWRTAREQVPQLEKPIIAHEVRLPGGRVLTVSQIVHRYRYDLMEEALHTTVSENRLARLTRLLESQVYGKR